MKLSSSRLGLNGAPACKPGISPAVRPLLLALVLAATSPVHALIPEPDNILYGTIAINGAPVLASQTNVFVEARRTTNGPAIATYQMGSNPQAGNYYSLRIPVESVAPIVDSNASKKGDSLWITLRDAAGVRGQTNFTLLERGQVVRVDFGMSVGDSDGDGLPDGWELLRFGSLTNGPGSTNLNGLTVLQNFILGTDPNDPGDGFRLYIDLTNGFKHVYFVARAAQGPGYEGMIRRYTLQFKPQIDGGFWTTVPNYGDIAGSNQVVNYFTSNTSTPGFYRGCAYLEGYALPGGDTDGDGLPDTWETLYFGNLARNGGYVGSNGVTAAQNYISGTDPNNPGSRFNLNITRSNNQQVVSFLALRAQGPGYEGKNRFYSLESSINVEGPYLPVPNFQSVLATNQTVVYPAPTSAPTTFFRGKVWLQ